MANSPAARTRKLSKQDLVRKIAKAMGLTQDAVRVPVDAFLDEIVNAADRGETVTLQGFGTFQRADRAPRKGRNPQTGEAVQVAGYSTVSFKPAQGLKDRMS
ncbi:HU family DNA-binding protein [Roseobacteraceae bacterium NS-SX3]